MYVCVKYIPLPVAQRCCDFSGYQASQHTWNPHNQGQEAIYPTATNAIEFNALARGVHGEPRFVFGDPRDEFGATKMKQWEPTTQPRKWMHTWTNECLRIPGHSSRSLLHSMASCAFKLHSCCLNMFNLFNYWVTLLPMCCAESEWKTGNRNNLRISIIHIEGWYNLILLPSLKIQS
jgi:hypothetical protein